MKQSLLICKDEKSILRVALVYVPISILCSFPTKDINRRPQRAGLRVILGGQKNVRKPQ